MTSRESVAIPGPGTSARTGGQVVVESLVAHGVTTTFGVPGESYLAVLDALHDTDIEVVTCRQEGGAAYMAEAWAKLTGRVGVCLVTRGPGATNASIGVHAAMQASTPMVLLVGQVGTHEQGREAFQEIDYRRMFDGIAKWATEITEIDDASEIMARAFHRAAAGRPGPVVVALPEDVLGATTGTAPVEPIPVDSQPPTDHELDTIVAALAAAERPVLLAGGGGWTDEGRRDLAAVAAAHDLPVVVSFRRNDLMDNTSDSYAGEAGVAMPTAVRQTLERADCVVALGSRFGEMTTGAWTIWPVGEPGITLLHVHPDPSQLAKIHTPTVGIVAQPNAVVAGLRARSPSASHGDWRAARRAAYVASLTPPPQPGSLDMGEVMAWLRGHLPADVVLTNGAGNFTVWPNKFFAFGPDARLLAPQSGSMGYGLPAAVAAKIADPDRTVVCFAGDGDVQMNLPELGTALQAGAQPIVLVIDNGMYGTIRMHQERNFPERVVGTDIVNPDFVRLGEAYGMHAETVDRTADFPDAFGRALASPTGALLRLIVEPTQLTPSQSIQQARAGEQV